MSRTKITDTLKETIKLYFVNRIIKRRRKMINRSELKINKLKLKLSEKSTDLSIKINSEIKVREKLIKETLEICDKYSK